MTVKEKTEGEATIGIYKREKHATKNNENKLSVRKLVVGLKKLYSLLIT